MSCGLELGSARLNWPSKLNSPGRSRLQPDDSRLVVLKPRKAATSIRALSGCHRNRAAKSSSRASTQEQAIVRSPHLWFVAVVSESSTRLNCEYLLCCLLPACLTACLSACLPTFPSRGPTGIRSGSNWTRPQHRGLLLE